MSLKVASAKLWNSMLELSPTGKIATSLIAKDALGCYLYVSQARSNKKMTPEQRADVANYDLANGVINVGLQLLAVKPIENLMKKFVDSKIIKHFFTNLDERLRDVDNKTVMKLLKHKSKIAEGTVALFSVIICQYFIKRAVSPFFSVPVGDKTKDLGIIRPKLYAGETYDKKNRKKNNIDNTEDIIPLEFTSNDSKQSDMLRDYKNAVAARAYEKAVTEK